jgi:hypothetical protein
LKTGFKAPLPVMNFGMKARQFPVSPGDFSQFAKKMDLQPFLGENRAPPLSQLESLIESSPNAKDKK